MTGTHTPADSTSIRVTAAAAADTPRRAVLRQLLQWPRAAAAVESGLAAAAEVPPGCGLAPAASASSGSTIARHLLAVQRPVAQVADDAVAVDEHVRRQPEALVRVEDGARGVEADGVGQVVRLGLGRHVVGRRLLDADGDHRAGPRARIAR